MRSPKPLPRPGPILMVLADGDDIFGAAHRLDELGRGGSTRLSAISPDPQARWRARLSRSIALTCWSTTLASN